jgi:hypothetical protein
MFADGAGSSRAVLFCIGRKTEKDFGFPAGSFRSERRDNDWLRLTSDDQRQVRVFDGERGDA